MARQPHAGGEGDQGGAPGHGPRRGGGTARAGARQSVTTRTRALYRLSRAGVLPLAGGFDALLGHAARVERLTRMLERDVEAMGELARRESALAEETSVAAARVASAHARVTTAF